MSDINKDGDGFRLEAEGRSSENGGIHEFVRERLVVQSINEALYPSQNPSRRSTIGEKLRHFRRRVIRWLAGDGN